MPEHKLLESDWKAFREHVRTWRDRYLATTNAEIAEILADPKRSPDEQFWDARDRIEKEADILVACLDDHRRSNMVMKLSAMCAHELVEEADLSVFSEELRKRVLELARILTD